MYDFIFLYHGLLFGASLSMMHSGLRLDSHWFGERLATLKSAVTYLHGVCTLYTVAVFSHKNEVQHINFKKTTQKRYIQLQ